MINPIAIENLFGIEGLNINWYGIIICVGIIAGVLVGRALARKKGYSFEMLIDMLILALPLAIICARIYYVAFEWEQYAGDFGKMIAIWEGGLAIYGAVIGALIAVLIFSRWKKVPFGDIVDIGAPCLILGQAIGRWGNFVNQEAFGNAILDPALQWFPYGVEITRQHTIFDTATNSWVNCTEVWHQATFFYESMWNLLVFVILMLYFKRAKHRGNVFVAYLMLYGLGRFVIEGLRTDSLWLIPGVIRVSQLLSAILVVGGIIYLAIMHKKPVKAQPYSGKYSLAFAGGVAAAEATQDSQENSMDTPDAPSDADSVEEAADTEDTVTSEETEAAPQEAAEEAQEPAGSDAAENAEEQEEGK